MSAQIGKLCRHIATARVRTDKGPGPGVDAPVHFQGVSLCKHESTTFIGTSKEFGSGVDTKVSGQIARMSVRMSTVRVRTDKGCCARVGGQRAFPTAGSVGVSGAVVMSAAAQVDSVPAREARERESWSCCHSGDGAASSLPLMPAHGL